MLSPSGWRRRPSGLSAEEGAGKKPTAAPPAKERAGLQGKGPARSGQGDERAGRVTGKF